MKIAYLSAFYPYRGGIAQFNAALYREFEKKHIINAYTFKRQYPDILFPGKTQLVSSTDKAEAIPAKRVLDTVNPLTYISSAKEIIKENPDLMLSKFWMPFFGPSLGYISGKTAKKGIKNIAILDNVIPHEKRPGDIAFIKYFLNRTHGFITMSDAVAKDLLKLKPNAIYEHQEHPLYTHFGEKHDKESSRKILNVPPDKKVLLFFGLIRDYKGLDLLLEALASLPEEYYLLIAGEPYSGFDKYEQMINKLGVSDRVKSVPRYIEDAETPLYFSAADLCVLPYKTATQSGIIGIAYQFDLPVAATNTGGLSEMIEPYGTGLMAGSPSTENIATAIKKFFSSDIRKVTDNIESYKRLASWSKMAEKIEGLYNKLS